MTVVFAPTASAAPGGAAVSDFGACLASQRSGDLLLMIDESSSLQTSDPDGARITSATYLLDQLAKYKDSSGIELDVAVAGFADEYSVESDWTSLDSASVPAVKGAVESFRDRTDGIDTDYRLALDGARTSLTEHTQPVDGVDPCQAVAWFSDGKIDFTPRGDTRKPYAPDLPLDTPEDVTRVVGAATESICRPGGVADQLRSSGIVVFGIGLAAGTASPADFDVMRSVATGEPSGSTTCGNVSSPAPGDFYLAQNIDDLLFAFDAFSTPGQAPLTREAGVCVVTVCEEGKHRFVLDNSIDSVGVLASADVPGLVPTLVAPDGTQLPLPASESDITTEVSGVDVAYRWQSPRTLSFDMTNPGTPNWQGVWALVFVDPTGDSAEARSRSNIHISGNLYPEWKGQRTTAIHSGETEVPVDLGIVDANRVEVDPESLLGTATLAVTLIESDGRQTVVGSDISKDRISDPLRLNLADVAPGQATVRLTLDVTTADATTPSGEVEPGTALAPQSVDVPLSIAPPIGYPALPRTIDFGTIEGAGEFTADLPVTGPGCAWLPQGSQTSVVASPDGVGTVGLSTAGAATVDACQELSDGEEGTLPISLQVENAANGAVNGTVEVMVAPNGEADRALPIDVEFRAELEKPLDTGNALLALIVALLLGPGIPLLLLYGGKWFTARIPARTLKAQQFPVTIAGSSVLRNGVPFGLNDRDLIEVVRGLDTPARSLDVAGVRLRTHVGWSPVGAGFVTASSPGRVGASSVLPATHGNSNEARLPLAVHNTWFVLHDPQGPADVATVVLLIGDDAGPTVRRSVVDDMTNRLPNVLATLRSSTKPGSGSPTPPVPASATSGFDPFGGGSSGPSSAGSYDPFGGGPGSQPPSRGQDPFGGPPRGQAPGPGPSGPSNKPFDPFGDGR
ncbi:VWA domain-containing protein [Rhodococcoides yunnanense]|uniref:VWA domain-containing protein n=1 Tax=Rhodococcoides yunnanense TaxID=278209 RepID=UPI001FE8E6E0|nr:VWA domain-containing protein [Rhodococcus yunnanensis]